MSTKRKLSILEVKKLSQDHVLDRVVGGTLNAATVVSTPMSLRPGQLIEAVAFGSRMASAIIDAWAFRFPTMEMTSDELEQAGGGNLYIGRPSEVSQHV